ncbi:MAG: DMT family transporter [Rhodospirillaceae bacterium]
MDGRAQQGAPIKLAGLTAVAMTAFAANSIFCRLALAETSIDPASFTAIRIGSGAVMLAIISILLSKKSGSPILRGSWRGATALLAYAVAFSFAYVSLEAGTGALLLFGAVQATMILWGLWCGERLATGQWIGLVLALGGLVVLLSPGVSAPDPLGAGLMLSAGIAWGVYCLLGKGTGDPVATTAGNFLRGLPIALAVAAVVLVSQGLDIDPMGVLYGVLSGALASGCGYAIWYAALPGLSAARAASVQLSVPVITALLAVVTLDEPVSLRLALASLAVLGGIALVIAGRVKGPSER